MRQYKIPDFKVGDRVAYTVQWLRSTGMSHSELSHARGEVIGITRLGERALIEVKWTVNDLPNRILDANLALVGPNPRFANVD